CRSFLLFLGFGLGCPIAARTPVLGKALAVLEDRRDRLSYGNGLAFLDQKAGQDAFARGLQLKSGLVGLNLSDDFTGGDFVAILFEPFEEGSLLHTVAHLG